MGKGDIVWVMVMSTNSDKECDHFYVSTWMIRIKTGKIWKRADVSSSVKIIVEKELGKYDLQIGKR